MRNGSSITTGKKATNEHATGAILANISEKQNRIAGRNRSVTQIEVRARNGHRIGTDSRDPEKIDLWEIDRQLFSPSHWLWMLPSCHMLRRLKMSPRKSNRVRSPIRCLRSPAFFLRNRNVTTFV